MLRRDKPRKRGERAVSNLEREGVVKEGLKKLSFV